MFTIGKGLFTEHKCTKVPKITKFDHFEFASNNKGKVVCKSELDGIEFVHTTFPDKNGPAGFPEVIQPPGLSETRKNYLYKNIRPYCKDEFKDLMCPAPSRCPEELEKKVREILRILTLPELWMLQDLPVRPSASLRTLAFVNGKIMAGIASLSSPPSPSPLRPPTRMRPTIYTAPAVSRPESGMSNASSASEMEIPPLQLPHILPIYIDFTPSWYTHAAAIHQLVNRDLNARSAKGEIIVETTTIDNFRTIQKYLIENKVKFFTRSLPGTRPLKVISGLPPFTTPELIADALVEKNFDVGNVFKLRTSRGETGLWVVTLQPDRDIETSNTPADIYKLSSLFYVKI
ncbi:hypothetical protein J6590_102966 [Homalodisca vitripennis]|nr:hypothetical protein J6590_102966 [Homalodisca vitripennis]